MHITYYGMRLRNSLPLTLDSIKAMPYEGAYAELEPDCWYIAKPKGSYGPWWLRIYHAWLVLTNRASVFQFSEDHFRMAGYATSGNIFKHKSSYKVREFEDSR